MINSGSLDTNNHSVFLIYYHLVLVVKYRRKAIDDEISDSLKSIFVRIGAMYGVKAEEWNHDIDHVHILIRATPDVNMSNFICGYKAASSRLIKKEFPRIKSLLWNGAFWSKSYCLLTTGGAPVEVIRKYIESQSEGRVIHHGRYKKGA